MNDNPNYQCLSYQDQYPDLVIVRDCYGGTGAVREKATAYLPQFPAEDNDAYAARLSQSNFFNAFKRTVQGFVGLVFRKNIAIGADIDSETKAQLENVDNQGTHIDVFGKQVLEAGLRDGHTFILVDMPQSVDESATLANELSTASRPYWVHYLKDQILNWRTVQRNGEIILTQVTIWEQVIIEDGQYSETLVDRYRVLRPGEWFLYEVVEQNDKTTVVSEIDSGKTSLDFIPLVVFYADKQDYFKSCPPLLDLAHENLRHYRLQSDLDNIMHVCNVPILTAKGRTNPKEPLTISRSVVDIPTEGDLKYTEHSGAAIAAAQKELDTSKATMAALGLMLLKEQPDGQQMTATESAYKTQAELSTLSGIARSLQDSLEKALEYHAAYVGKSGGSLEVNQDFSAVELSPQMLQTLSTMEADGQYKLEWLWDLMERANLMPPGVDEKEQADAMAEMMAARKEKADIGNALLNFERGQGAANLM